MRLFRAHSPIVVFMALLSALVCVAALAYAASDAVSVIVDAALDDRPHGLDLAQLHAQTVCHRVAARSSERAIDEEDADQHFRESFRQLDEALLIQLPKRIEGNLPDMAVGIGKVAVIAAPEGLCRRFEDARACGFGACPFNASRASAAADTMDRTPKTPDLPPEPGVATGTPACDPRRALRRASRRAPQ